MRQFGWTDEDVYLVAERGWHLYLQGRYVEAATIFDGLLAVDPENSYAAGALAGTWIAMGRPDMAVERLNAFLALRPGDMETRARRCEALLACGRQEEAKADWQALPHKQRFAALALRLEATTAAADR